MNPHPFDLFVMKLRIAILADPILKALAGSPSGRGDGQPATWLPHFARELFLEEDLEVTWISLRKGIPKTIRTSWERHQFIEIPGIPITLDVLIGYALGARRLRRVLDEVQPDILHCWGTEGSYSAMLGYRNIPSLLSMNGVLGALKAKQILPLGWRWKLQTAWEKKWLAKADRISTESEWACEAVLRIHPNASVSVVPYGVNPSFYEIEWQPDPDDPFIFFAGTVNKGKGVDILLNAIESLPQRSWRCEIAGDGPLRNPLEARATPGVTWLGTLDWKALQQKLSKAWCLVLPTLADSNPNVIKEARVAGLPVITTIHGGQAGYLKNDGNAMILDEINPSSLAMALQGMMAGGCEKIHKMGAYGHREDRDRFQSCHTVSGFKKIYGDLAGNATR